ncbi:PAC2 family protein, partial [Planctomycetota bacterium]
MGGQVTYGPDPRQLRRVHAERRIAIAVTIEPAGGSVTKEGSLGADAVTIDEEPALRDASLVLGFHGWMNGGDVSTGTVDYLHEELNARPVARIDLRDAYIYNLPGSMETSALFRPHTKIKAGLITEYEPPKNTFHCADEHNLLLLRGKEPNLKWTEFAECVF